MKSCETKEKLYHSWNLDPNNKLKNNLLTILNKIIEESKIIYEKKLIENNFND